MSADQEFEFIVVGSGAGGGPVAANLARAGHSVLVLEAGGTEAPPDYASEVPAFHTLASEKDTMSWRFFVRHYRDRTQQARDTKFCPEHDGVFYPRAATVGGCTAHNAMIFVCPNDRDWNAIAEITGDESWRAERMWPFLERLEACHYRPIWRLVQQVIGWNPSGHGFRGWLTTSEADPALALHDHELLKIVTNAAWRTVWGVGGLLARARAALKTWFDPNDLRGLRRGLEGLRMTPLTTRKGHRTGARERLEQTQRDHPDRLTIRTHALVTRVLLDADRRATGVEYLEGAHLYWSDPLCPADAAGADRAAMSAGAGSAGGTLRRVMATREVILAAGSFNTPQILQLSGIGPADLLHQHGIEVRVPAAGVGANLQDRYEVSVVTRMKRPFRLIGGAVMRPPAPGQAPDKFLQEWIDSGSGVYTSNGAVLSILKKSSPTLADPDLLLFGLVTNFRGYYPGYSIAVSEAHKAFTWTILKGYNRNRAGTVRIRSANPREPPEICFRYFEEGTPGWERDLEALTDAVLFVRGIASQYADLIDAEEVPGPAVQSRDQIRQFVKDEAWGHHACGTCRIGAAGDEHAVLDSRFQVRGTTGLRVVDASIFPNIPGLFIVSAVYLAAEKASAVILEDVGRARTESHP